MPAYKVEICGVNTAKLPILKETEKEALFARIRQGDQEAREMYIKGNLRLVLSVIKRFSGSHENLDDLFQIGCIGLIKSIDNFNPDLQVKFSTYAVPMIIGEIRRYLRDNNSIRVSRSLRDTMPRKFCPGIHLRNLPCRRSQQNPELPQKTFCTHWMRSRVRSASMIRSTPMGAIPFMSWIRSVTRKIKKKTGWKNSH